MEYYRKFIKEMVDKINNYESLKRICMLVEYLYVNKEEDN